MWNPQHVHVNQEYDDKPWELGLGFLYNFRPSQSLLSLSTDSLPRASCSLAKSCNVWVEKVGHFSGMLSSKSMSRKMCGIERRKDGFAHGLSKQQKYGKLLEQTNQIWGWIKISIAFNIYLSRQSYY